MSADIYVGKAEQKKDSGRGNKMITINLMPGDNVSCLHDIEARGTVIDWLDNFNLKVEWQSAPQSTPWRAWYDADTVPHEYLTPMVEEALSIVSP